MGKTLSLKRAVIFGGNLSEINPQICSVICDTDLIICADAGYKFALQNNIKPDIIVGDFDSAPYPDNTDSEIIKLPTHKNDTDLQFAVRLALERGCNDFILTGVTGGRLDHTIATITTLNYLSDRAKSSCVVDLNTKAFIVNNTLKVKKPDYACYLSVFALSEVAEGVSIKGAEYSIENAKLNNSFPLGVSNEFNADEVEISLKTGRLLVMIVKRQ